VEEEVVKMLYLCNFLPTYKVTFQRLIWGDLRHSTNVCFCPV